MKIHLRSAGIAAVFGIACFGTLHAQNGPSAKTVAAQNRGLNAAAHAPMFSQRAADKVKEVRDGGISHKRDESDLDAPTPSSEGRLPAMQAPGTGAQPPAQAAGQPAAPPPPPPTIAWRLKGMVHSKGGGIAVIDTGGPNPVLLRPGQRIDAHSKLVSVGRQMVVVEFSGHQLSIYPW